MRPTLRLIANRDSLITLIIKKKKKKLKKKNYKNEINIPLPFHCSDPQRKRS